MATLHFNSKSGQWAFLSNFYACLIDYEGQRYPSVEHAYQAAKTLDAEQRREIACAPSPGQAKRAGSRVTLRPDWEAIRAGVMSELLEKKFRDPELKTRLLATGDATLVHKAPWDAYWGDGPDGKGQNLQGQLLMALRAELAYENSPQMDFSALAF